MFCTLPPMLKARPEGVRMDGSLSATVAAATVDDEDEGEDEEVGKEPVTGEVREQDGAVGENELA